MNFLTRMALLIVVGLPPLGNAQTADAPVSSAQEIPPPPLVTAPPEAPPAAQEPAPPPQGELIPRTWQPQRPDYFVPRILAGTFLGTLAGAGGLLGGFLIGMELAQGCDLFDGPCSADEIFVQTLPAVVSTGLLSSLVVYGMGNAFYGEGELSATMLGGFAGTGIGMLLSIASQSYAGILLIPPLAAIGAVIAYELSDTQWENEQQKARLGSTRVQWVPVVGVTPGGGVLGGLAGRF